MWHPCNLAAKESGLECACVNNDFTVVPSGGHRCPWVSMCTMWLLHSKWLLGWFRRPQLWAPGDWQLHQDNAPAHVSHLVQSFLAKHQITQVTQLPLQPNFGTLWLLDFPQTKITLKGKTFQTISEIQENSKGQLMAIGRTVWSPNVPTLKRTEASLSYVQRFLYHVSSLINVSIFHITWLETSWADLVHESA